MMHVVMLDFGHVTYLISHGCPVCLSWPGTELSRYATLCTVAQSCSGYVSLCWVMLCTPQLSPVMCQLSAWRPQLTLPQLEREQKKAQEGKLSNFTSITIHFIINERMVKHISSRVKKGNFFMQGWILALFLSSSFFVCIMSCVFDHSSTFPLYQSMTQILHTTANFQLVLNYLPLHFFSFSIPPVKHNPLFCCQ